MIKSIIIIAILFSVEIPVWKKLGTGLHLSEYKIKKTSQYGNSTITVLKIDPEVYNINLFNTDMLTVEQCADINQQVATINAGMFKHNGQNVGYMRHYSDFNNPMLNKDNAILAFNRIDDSVPRVQIIDRKLQDWNELKTKYHSFTQSIRMVDKQGNNRWTLQDKMWSVACVAIDKEGNLLFIHCRSPYKMYDFINIMMSSEYNIENMMYLEGGPEASLFVKTDTAIIRRIGSYETGFQENNINKSYWGLPNIIGISRR